MPDAVPTNRGSLQFLITPTGDLQNHATNVRLLAQLWADRSLIRGDDLGPGRPGRLRSRRVAQLLSRSRRRRRAPDDRRPRALARGLAPCVRATSTSPASPYRDSGKPRTVPLDSAEGRMLVEQSMLLGLRGRELDRPGIVAQRLRRARPVQSLATAGLRPAGDVAA